MGTRLEIVLSDGTPAVSLNESLAHSTPIELSVLSLHPQAPVSEDLYMQSLNYLFRGTTNFASGKIGRVFVEKDWFGSIEKNMDAIYWNAIPDKLYVVVYDISIEEISEHFYIADSVRFKKKRRPKVEPIWNEKLIKPTSKTLKEGLKTAIEIAAEFPTEYKLVWGHNGKQGLFVLNPKGKKIDVADIVEPETFILFRLLIALASKELHAGVFCIDARAMSDTLLTSLVETSKTFYGDSFIFIKHLNSSSKIPRKKVVLPILK